MPRKNTGPRLRWNKRRGSYYIYWYEKGRECSKGTGTTDSELAQIRLQEHLGQVERPNGPNPPDRYKVIDALSLYAQRHAPHTAAPERIGYAIDALLTFFSTYSVGEITPSLCDRYMRHRKRSIGTVRRELTTLRAAISFAVKEGFLSRTVPIKLPPRPEGKDRWLTHHEAAKLLWEARKGRGRKHLPLFILIALYTGARKEAILSLTWAQVDMERRRIDFAKGRRKTEKGRALLPIPNRLYPFLQYAWKRRSSDIGTVLHIDGQPIGDIKKGFAAAAERAGLEDVTPHTLRHTCATWMAQRGVPMFNIAGWLGQSVASTTERYAHQSPDYMEAALFAVDRR